MLKYYNFTAPICQYLFLDKNKDTHKNAQIFIIFFLF